MQTRRSTEADVEDARIAVATEAALTGPIFKRTHCERVDTYVGMALSNAGALFIILTAAATLHVCDVD